MGAIRNGTRKSVMALAQTEEIARRLTAVAPDVDVEIVKFETTGDSDQTSKLLQHGGKGRAFVAEIRRRLFREISTKLPQLGTPYRRSGDCDFRFWQILLQNSFGIGQHKFSGPYVRRTNNDLRDYVIP